MLGNPAPLWKGVGQEMDPGEFDQWGPWSEVWIEVNPQDGGDVARIEQLEDQVKHLQLQVNGFITALAHVADRIVPELARGDLTPQRRAELAGEVKRIREQFIGPAPG